jgi:hypothetical protein
MILNFSKWKRLYEQGTEPEITPTEKSAAIVADFNASTKEEAQQIASTKGEERFGKGNYLVFDDDAGSFVFDRAEYEARKKAIPVTTPASKENPRFDPEFPRADGKSKGRFVKTNLQTGKAVPITNGQDLINTMGTAHFLDLDGLRKTKYGSKSTYSGLMGRRNTAADQFIRSMDPTVRAVEEPVGKWGDLCKFLVRGSEYFQKGFPGVGSPCLEPWSQLLYEMPNDKRFAVYLP